MDCLTGRIYEAEQVETMPHERRQYMRQMEVPPTPRQLAKRRVGRNDPCPCGSGKKFKRCCLMGKY